MSQVQGFLKRLFYDVDSPLLENLEKHREEIQGSGETPKAPMSKTEAMNILKNIFRLFQFSTAHDKLLLFIGTIFTFIHGASFPVFALLFASLSETFIAQSFGRVYNSSAFNLTHAEGDDFNATETASSIVGNLMGGNTTFDKEAAAHAILNFIGDTIGSFGPQKPLDKLGFIDYANSLSNTYVVMGVVVFISSFIQTYCWETAADNQAYRIRQKFLYQLLRQEIPFFDTRTAGNLMVKLADDVERVREGIGHKFSIVLEYSSCFAVGVFFGLAINWQLALLFGTSVPFILTKILFIGREVSTKSMDQQEEYARAGAISSEVLANVRTVSAFGTELVESKIYQDELQAGIGKAISKYTFIGYGTGFLHIIIYSSYAAGFYYACNKLVAHEVTPRQVYTVFFCVSIGVLALSNILAFISTVANATGSLKIIAPIMSTLPAIDSYSTKGRRPKKVTGKIKFSNVCYHFASRDDLSVVRDLSFTIKPGETIAIVGSSGSGKSTLVNLLMRFYDHQSGSILFDDADVRGLNVTWLREQIGTVRRDPLFEEMSVFDNIRGTRTDVKRDDIENAAKLAGAHDFIESLPKGYDTMLGFNDRQFRSGQRQSLAIARILIRNPRILILDEAMSGLDPKAASRVYDNILESRVGRTTILLSHRLNLIEKVDTIYVLEDGEIVESGTHDELISKEGLYYKFAKNEHILDALEVDPEDRAVRAGETIETDKVEIRDPTSTLKTPAPKAIASQRIDSDQSIIDIDLAAAEYDKGLKFPTFNDMYQILRDEELGKYVLLGLAGSVISGAALPIFALVFSQLFITFSESGDQLFKDASFWMKATIGVGIFSAFGIWLRTLFVSVCGEYLTFRLRATTYLSILRQAIGWFEDENNSPGRLNTRLASDAPFIKVAVGTTLGTALSALVSMIGAVIVALVLEWQLAVIISCAIPIFLSFIYIQKTLYEKHQMEISRQMESALRLASRAVNNIWTLQALNHEANVLRRFKNLVDPAFAEAHKQSRSYSLMFALTEMIPFIIFAILFRVGVYLIDVNDLDPILLFKAFIVTAFCAITIGHVGSFVPDYVKAKLSMAHIFSIYEIESTIDAFEQDGECPPEFPGKITFNDVYFSYPMRPNNKVLRGVSFELEAGKCLAVIGKAGGKSTLLSLLVRFYDVQSGKVMIDGIEVKNLNLDFLRSNSALVAQDMTLFDRSVGENICYGYGGEEEGADLEAVIKSVADRAGVTEFIETLPQGFDTKVGIGGCRLTEGQRRRILLTRTLMRNPRILLLDNPTFALDPEDELLVQKLLVIAKEGRTCIIASNRPTTVKHADFVAVMVNGKVDEFGTHEQLNELKGHYHDFMKASEGY